MSARGRPLARDGGHVPGVGLGGLPIGPAGLSRLPNAGGAWPPARRRPPRAPLPDCGSASAAWHRAPVRRLCGRRADATALANGTAWLRFGTGPCDQTRGDAGGCPSGTAGLPTPNRRPVTHPPPVGRKGRRRGGRASRTRTRRETWTGRRGRDGERAARNRRTTPATSTTPRRASYWAPLRRKRHHKGHGPRRPSERGAPTQHAEGRTGDCPGPREETTTRRHVTRGAGGGGGGKRTAPSRGSRSDAIVSHPHPLPETQPRARGACAAACVRALDAAGSECAVGVAAADGTAWHSRWGWGLPRPCFAAECICLAAKVSVEPPPPPTAPVRRPPGSIGRCSGLRCVTGNTISTRATHHMPIGRPVAHLWAGGLSIGGAEGVDRAPRPPLPPKGSALLRMPAVVRMFAYHSRRFKGERPIGATG